MTIEESVEHLRKYPMSWLLLTRGEIKLLRKKLSLWENFRLKVGEFDPNPRNGWTKETIRAQVWLRIFRFPWSKK